MQRLKNKTFVKGSKEGKTIITTGQVIWFIKERKQKLKIHAEAHVKRNK